MNRYPYRRRDDLVRMQALLLATRPTTNLNDFPTPQDLAELLEQTDIRSNTALWWLEDRLAAYALMVDGKLHVDALPEAEARLKAELEAWRETLSSESAEVA